MIRTYSAKPGEVTQDWHLVDASGQVLGRLAARVARILMGKHRPTYTPHVDTGDFVVIVNADKVVVTGRKPEQRLIRSHSGYVGHLKEVPLATVLEKEPERIVRLAVRRMLPKTKMGRKMFSKLKVYRGAEHPHQAQKPQPLKLD